MCFVGICILLLLLLLYYILHLCARAHVLMCMVICITPNKAEYLQQVFVYLLACCVYVCFVYACALVCFIHVCTCVCVCVCVCVRVCMCEFGSTLKYTHIENEELL